MDDKPWRVATLVCPHCGHEAVHVWHMDTKELECGRCAKFSPVKGIGWMFKYGIAEPLSAPPEPVARN